MNLAEIQYGKYLKDFEITGIEKIPIGDPSLEESEVRIEFREKEERCPRGDLKKNGYQNPIEVIDHTVGGCVTYLKFYRRRWKEEEGEDNISNQYDIAIKGTKLTKSFGNFLKEKDRRGGNR